ncbi:50S ribosomal protein L14 [bacterium]|nr:50S ribosomal protein L14 [bacterium]|tara:strand:- start:4196 stop:4561 length:366 start_codon:yes stop_codon:yes gene_type:complete
MIQEGTILKVADNSGAKKVRCFRILGGTRRRYARIGDVLVASVQTAEPRKQVKKKDIVKALVVRTRKETKRRDGSYIRFDENAAVLVDGKNPRGTRVFGPIPREVKEKGFDAIASLAKDLV